ncbi:MAG: hypothetical protein ACREHD_31595 [Pirellulales bacterium]
MITPVWAPDDEALRDYLLRQKPDLVVTSVFEPSGGHHFDEMQSWLQKQADLCELVYAEERFCLYRFVGPTAPDERE